jgi:hypothetical protein
MCDHNNWGQSRSIAHLCPSSYYLPIIYLLSLPALFTDGCLYLEFGVFYHGCSYADTRHEGKCHDESYLLGCGFSSGYIELQIRYLDSLLGLLRDEAIDEIMVFCSSYDVESAMDLIICLCSISTWGDSSWSFLSICIHRSSCDTHILTS